MNSVIVPGGYTPGAYTCLRSLSKQGFNTIVASSLADNPSTSSRFCDEYVSTPPEDELVAYKDALLRIAARSDVLTIIPIRQQLPYILSKYRSEFDDHVELVVPPLESLKELYDRVNLMNTAEEAGVPVPRTQLLDEVTDWNTDQIIKSRYNVLTEEFCDSYSATDFKTIKDVVHLPAGKRPNVDKIRTEMEHTPIVQEYIRSSERYVFGALYDEGEPLATFQHRQLRGDSYTGGGGVYRVSVDRPELDAIARQLLNHLDWHGLACIEYMKDAETGEYKPIEINPRIWQSVPCAIHSGADFPYYYLLQAMGRSDLIEPGYNIGVGCHQLYGELGYLLSILRDDSELLDKPSLSKEVWNVVLSCIKNPKFDYFHLDDPLPAIRSFNNVL